VEVPLIVAGVLFVLWPLQYRRSIGRIRRRLWERGGDVQKFDRAMNRAWIRAAVVSSPFAGALLIVLGVLGK
jgi:hypothetical protein